MGFTEIIDVSLPIRTGMLVFPGDQNYVVQEQRSIAAGNYSNLSSFQMSMHLGTHLDAPLHFIKDGKSIADLDLTAFFGKAKVIEINTKKPITAVELRHFPVEKGDRILIKNAVNEGLLKQSNFEEKFVALDVSAAEFLVEREVSLIGIDYLSIETAESGHQVHRRLLENNIHILEGLVLKEVLPGEYFLACQPLNLERGNGSPVRAVLLK